LRHQGGDALCHGLIASSSDNTSGKDQNINITTSGVKSPATYPQHGVSIGVRAGLTGFVGVPDHTIASRAQ
jgi:hypothetical protein